MPKGKYQKFNYPIEHILCCIGTKHSDVVKARSTEHNGKIHITYNLNYHPKCIASLQYKQKLSTGSKRRENGQNVIRDDRAYATIKNSLIYEGA